MMGPKMLGMLALKKTIPQNRQADRHTNNADIKKRLSPHTVHQEDGHQGHENVHYPHDVRFPESQMAGDAGQFKYAGCIIEDGVDADELLEEEKPDAAQTGPA